MFNQVLGVLGLMNVNINQHIKHQVYIPNILWKVIKFHGSKPPIRGVLSNHLWKYSWDDGIPTSQKSSYCTKLPSGKHTKSYWKWPSRNSWHFPIQNGGSFHRFFVCLPGRVIFSAWICRRDRTGPPATDMGKTRGKPMEKAEQSMNKNINKYIMIYIYIQLYTWDGESLIVSKKCLSFFWWFFIFHSHRGKTIQDEFLAIQGWGWWKNTIGKSSKT